MIKFYLKKNVITPNSTHYYRYTIATEQGHEMFTFNASDDKDALAQARRFTSSWTEGTVIAEFDNDSEKGEIENECC